MRDLSALRKGEWGYVAGLAAEENMKKRLMDLGFTKGAKIRCLLLSHFSGMRAYEVRGSVIALRLMDARGIFLEEMRHE